jgi:hypothetical protein
MHIESLGTVTTCSNKFFDKKPHQTTLRAGKNHKKPPKFRVQCGFPVEGQIFRFKAEFDCDTIKSAQNRQKCQVCSHEKNNERPSKIPGRS